MTGIQSDYYLSVGALFLFFSTATPEFSFLIPCFQAKKNPLPTETVRQNSGQQMAFASSVDVGWGGNAQRIHNVCVGVVAKHPQGENAKRLFSRAA